jgi:hypothetical protein
MNDTFLVRTVPNDDNELSIDDIQTKLTQLQLKTTLSDDQSLKKPTPRHQTTPMELIILEKNQDDIVVNLFFCKFKKTNFCFSVSKCNRS